MVDASCGLHSLFQRGTRSTFQFGWPVRRTDRGGRANSDITSGFVPMPFQHSIVRTSEIYVSTEWPLRIATRWIVAGTRRREKNPKVAAFGTSSNGSLAARSGRISWRGDHILPVPLFTHRRIGFSIFAVRSSLCAQWEENPKRHHYYPCTGGRRAMNTCQCSPTDRKSVV